MRASSCIGRVGGLAAALGAGALMAFGGAGSAAADPGVPAETESAASSDDTSPDPSARTPRRAAKAIGGQADPGSRHRPAATRTQKRVSATSTSAVKTHPARARAVDTPAVRPAATVRVATASAGTPAAAVAAVAAIADAAPAAPVARKSATPAPQPSPAAALPAAARAGSLNVLLGPAPGSDPGQPAESPAGWAVLAAARRGFGRPESTPFVMGSAPTGQALVPQAAATTLNKPPVIGTVSVGSPNAGTGAVTGTVTATDPNRDRITFRATTSSKGRVAVTAAGVFTYTPTSAARHAAAKIGAPAAARTDTVTVTVTDARRATTTASVAVPILPKNSVPVASATVGTPSAATGVVSGSVKATDADGDVRTYTANATTAKGAVSVNSASGAFTYTPTTTARHNAAALAATTADKTDAFTVNVADGYGGQVAVPVTVTIGPRNAAPVSGIPTLSTNPATGVVTGFVNATDPDGDTLTYAELDTSTAKGAVAVSSTGSFTYTPTAAARQNAGAVNATAADTADTFTVSVSDRYGGTSAVAVSVPIVASVSPVTPETGHMAVGMNLESVVDWSPAWTFTDAFKASRPWISQSFNPQTWQTTWDPAQAPALDVDANGNIRSLKTWSQNGVQMKQYAGTLMFDALGGDYAAGTYHAQWDGTGVVTFGFDAVVTSSGKTADGRNFAELKVTPTDNGIYMRIEETSPTDPVRNFNVWMPDYNGQSFVGQRWQPGATFSPFHPLFLSRLQPFGALRFMGMQETNGSDITTWAQRRDANDIRQGSGAEGTPSEPVANGISVEYMVELANELDADPWFNMPYAADDTFVRNFATYVSQHLEPGRTVYVEWANEVWNFGWGFEASQWVADKAKAAGLDPDYGQWIVAGQEAKRDMAIWSDVLAGQSSLHLVRVAAGWAAVDWVTNQIAENMDGQFDAIAIAPYITPTDDQRAGYTSATTVDRVIADTRANVAEALRWTANHEQLAQEWSAKLGRPIELVAYEGGPHLDGRAAAYQNAFYAATNDPRMGEIYRDYLKGLDAAGMDLYMDFQFTGQAGAAPWGDFAKLHRMDQSLATAYRYNAVVSAADGTLWPAIT